MLKPDRLCALRDKIRGCFVGVAIGDALGVPWEMCTPEEILDLTNGKGVIGLQDIPAGRERKLKDTRGLKLGDTSDDWQLTAAVATSLIRVGEFNIFDQALAHVEAFENSTCGWGGTTRDAMKEMKLYFDSRGREGRSPDVLPEPKPRRGAGNGVIMKLAPLVCYYCLYSEENEAEGTWPYLGYWTEDLGEMTHPDEYATAAAKIIAYFMGDILSGYGAEPATASVALRSIDHVLKNAENVDSIHRVFGDKDRRGEILSSAKLLRETAGTSCLATETAAFTIGTFLRHPTDFRAALLEAVNAGGDTDTNASIVGALVGANVGLKEILSLSWPELAHQTISSVREAINIADALVDSFVEDPDS